MPLTILAHDGSTYAGAKRGAKIEVGINIQRSVMRYYPEVNDTVPNVAGQTQWRVVSDKFSRDVEFQGEVLSNTGVMLWTMASALTFAADKDEFTGQGGSAGTFYMDDATVTAARAGWLSVVIKASAKPTL